MFYSRKAIQAALDKAEGQVIDLKSQLENFDETKAEKTQLEQDLKQAKSDLTELQGKYDAQKAELDAANGKLETFDAEVDKAATAKVASIGQPKPQSTASESDADPLAEYKAMKPGAERRAYRKAHPELFKK